MLAQIFKERFRYAQGEWARGRERFSCEVCVH